MDGIQNICTSCGACCAYFRVSFYWAESREDSCGVPYALTEKITPFLSCMQGTNARIARCVALKGEIGQSVLCSIYLNRPTPCREFSPSGLNDRVYEACDRARNHYGLLPLATVLKQN